MRYALLVAAFVIGSVTTATQADIGTTVTAANMWADLGVTPLPGGSLVAFVADIAGDGFGDHSLNPLGPDTFVNDDDDVLLGVGPANPGPGFMQNGFTWSSVAPEAVGKEFAILHFNTPFIDETQPGAGPDVNYGVFATGDVVPPDPTLDAQFFYLTTDVQGDKDPDAFYAPYVTTPEPASALLLVISGSLLASRRRAR
jgi:hypothetical protein